MNWENMQVFKIETNYKNSCLQVFYRMAGLKISENSQENICGGVLSQYICGYLFSNFIKIGPQHKCVPENVPKFSEELFLNCTSGQLLLNLQAILIVSTPSCLTCILKNGGGGWGHS